MDTEDIRNILIARKMSGGGSSPMPTYQTKTITPDFSDGDVTVTADSGYDALSEVVVEKDDNLIANNIKNGVTINGITGTYEGDSMKIIPVSIDFGEHFGILLGDIDTATIYNYIVNGEAVILRYMEESPSDTGYSFIYDFLFAECNGNTSPMIFGMVNYDTNHGDLSQYLLYFNIAEGEQAFTVVNKFITA